MLRFFFLLALVAVGYAAEPAAAPQNPVQPDDPAWRDLRDAFARRPAAGVSDFEERRWFTFKKTPTVLHGVARVSTERGLSLAYAGPPARIVIIDDRGLLLREAGRDSVPPADVRTGGPDGVLLHLLRFDLKALAEEFDISGERTGAAWSLTLLPRTEALRRTLGQIAVAGEGTDVRRIELRRSATQRVEILIAPPQRLGAPFTADELRLFFR